MLGVKGNREQGTVNVLTYSRSAIRLGRLALPKGALTLISLCQTGKMVVVQASIRKTFTITFPVVLENYFENLVKQGF